MKKYTSRAFNYIRHGVWAVDPEKLDKRNRYYVKFLRIVLLAIENFQRKNLILQASALTFFSLLSIVPVVAMIFGIAKGFGLDEVLRQELYHSFEKQPQLLEQILGFVNGLLENTQGGVVAGFGFVLLLFSVLQVLSNIEESFNSIWQITVNRTWIRKFTDYLAIMVIAPLFIVSSGSANIYVSVLIKTLAENWIAFDFLKQLVYFSINLIPFFLSGLLFSMVYLVIPNTKVKPRSALIAGFFAGFSFQLFQYLYVEFQVGVSRFNAIYGSFAFFPLFIIFLQFSWVIVLIGAEISYSLQNINQYIDDRKVFKPNGRQRLVLTLAVVTQSVEHFRHGKPAPSVADFSDKLRLPFKPMKRFCQELCVVGLLSEVIIEGKTEHGYLPAVDPELIDLAFIIEKMGNSEGVAEAEFDALPTLQVYEDILAPVYADLAKSPNNVNILDLVKSGEKEVVTAPKTT